MAIILPLGKDDQGRLPFLISQVLAVCSGIRVEMTALALAGVSDDLCAPVMFGICTSLVLGCIMSSTVRAIFSKSIILREFMNERPIPNPRHPFTHYWTRRLLWTAAVGFFSDFHPAFNGIHMAYAGISCYLHRKRPGGPPILLSGLVACSRWLLGWDCMSLLRLLWSPSLIVPALAIILGPLCVIAKISGLMAALEVAGTVVLTPTLLFSSHC